MFSISKNEILESQQGSNLIFRVSFTTSSILLVIGFLLFTIFQSSPELILFGLLAMIVGGIQVFADFGWMAILKANRKHINTWSEALEFVSETKGQKIFLAPIIMDLTFLLVCIWLFATI